MERFATVKNIGGRRNKLDTICRCCGLQGDEMYPIIDGEVSEDGVDFRQKVSCLIGEYLLLFRENLDLTFLYPFRY